MAPDGNFVELVRIGDPIEADLLTAFLGNSEIEFIVQNRMGTGMMNQLMPRAQNAVIFRVRKENLERGKELLEEYRKMQSGEIIPSQMLPEDEEEGKEGGGSEGAE